MTGRHSYVRYLPVEKDALTWGLHVIDCGIVDMAAGQGYPEDVRHPEGYVYEWSNGRKLSEYQIVYITRGTGKFGSKKIKQRQIIPGDILILFPGEWHRYRWSEETGWDECWIGFNGEYAGRLMKNFFGKSERIIHVGFDLNLYQTIRALPEIMDRAAPGYQQVLAAKAIEVIALLRSLVLKGGGQLVVEKMIQDIRMHLIAEIDRNIDFHSVAASVGMCYSKFCAAFKERTGLPPHQYVIQTRINRAEELLMHTRQPVSDIAEALGFDSLYYFSRLFKSKTGLSPSGFRDKNGRERADV